jgi:hypothetical protein
MCYVCLGCGGCGKRKSEMYSFDRKCLKCGTVIANGIAVCPNCGFDPTPGKMPAKNSHTFEQQNQKNIE